SGDLSQALAAIEKAVANRPGEDSLRAERNKLEQAAYQRQLRRLGEIGDGTAGFGPRDEYRRGGEPARLGERRRHAEARALWLRLGLPKPAHGWDDLAAAKLARAVELVRARRPASFGAKLSAWDAVVKGRPELQLDPSAGAAVAAYLTRQEEGDSDEGP